MSSHPDKNRATQLSIHRFKVFIQLNKKVQMNFITRKYFEFKTIPPIAKNNALDETHVDRVRRLREEKKLWNKPTPPSAFLLHLNILARTQFIDEFLSTQNSVKNECIKFVDPLLGNSSEKSEYNEEESSKTNGISINDEERDALDFVLSDLFRFEFVSFFFI